MGRRIIGLMCMAILAAVLAGCSSKEDAYVVKSPLPPEPQQGQTPGH